MTSRPPYWFSKTMKRRPGWCPKPVLWEMNLSISFVPTNLHNSWPREWKRFTLGLQRRDKTAMLVVDKIEFFLEQFTWKWSVVPRGEKCFCSWPTTSPPWRNVQTSNMWVHSFFFGMLAFSTSRLDTKRKKSAAVHWRGPPRVWNKIICYSCSPNKIKNQIIPWTSLDSWLSVLFSVKIRKIRPQKRAPCFATLLQTSWKAVLRVLPPTNQTCLATNQDVAGCKKLL